MSTTNQSFSQSLKQSPSSAMALMLCNPFQVPQILQPPCYPPPPFLLPFSIDPLHPPFPDAAILKLLLLLLLLLRELHVQQPYLIAAAALVAVTCTAAAAAFSCCCCCCAKLLGAASPGTMPPRAVSPSATENRGRGGPACFWHASCAS